MKHKVAKLVLITLLVPLFGIAYAVVTSQSFDETFGINESLSTQLLATIKQPFGEIIGVGDSLSTQLLATIKQPFGEIFVVGDSLNAQLLAAIRPAMGEPLGIGDQLTALVVSNVISGTSSTAVTTDSAGHTILTGKDSTGKVLAQIVLPLGTIGTPSITFTTSGADMMTQTTGITVPYPPGKSIKMNSNPGSTKACIVDSPTSVSLQTVSCIENKSTSTIVLDCSTTGITRTVSGFPNTPASRTYTCTISNEGGQNYIKVDGLAFSTVIIDNTPPEAYNQFDPLTKNDLVFGRDALSGVQPGSVTPLSVIPTRWGDDGDKQESSDQNENQNGPNNQGNAELRTYLVSDLLGNTISLVEKVKKQDHEIDVKMVSVKYNNGVVIKLGENEKQFKWSLGKDGTLKELDQEMKIGRDGNKQTVKAEFDSKKNKTTVTVEKPRHETKKDFAGLVLLRMATSNGNLGIEFP
ncbi:MAG TPA: hypothetical protein VEU72_01010 [Nitrosopumilaceae archaeon]|nr:hypothetical protein [Nitrosopumilaceae archaeon]